jgi:hypothetical protein
LRLLAFYIRRRAKIRGWNKLPTETFGQPREQSCSESVKRIDLPFVDWIRLANRWSISNSLAKGGGERSLKWRRKNPRFLGFVFFDPIHSTALLIFFAVRFLRFLSGFCFFFLLSSDRPRR